MDTRNNNTTEASDVNKYSHLSSGEMEKLLTDPKLNDQERKELEDLLLKISENVKNGNTSTTQELEEVLATNESPKSKKLSAKLKALIFSLLITVGAVSGDLAQDGKLNAYGLTGNGGGNNNKTELPVSMNDGESKAKTISLTEAQKENLTPEELAVLEEIMNAINAHSSIKSREQTLTDNNLQSEKDREYFIGLIDDYITKIEETQEKVKEITDKDEIITKFKSDKGLSKLDFSLADPEAAKTALIELKQKFIDQPLNDQEEINEPVDTNKGDRGEVHTNSVDNIVKTDVTKDDYDATQAQIAALEAEINAAKAKEKAYYTDNAQSIATNYKNALALYLANGIKMDALMIHKREYEKLVDQFNGKHLVGAKTKSKIDSDELAITDKQTEEMLNKNLSPEHKKALEELRKSEEELRKSEEELKKAIEEGKKLDKQLKEAKAILNSLNSVSQK